MMYPAISVYRQVNKMITKPSGLVDGPYGAWMVEYHNGTEDTSETRLGNIRNSLNLVTEAFNTADHIEYSLGYGLTGFLWTIQWLEKYVKEISGIIDKDDLIPILEVECKRMIQGGNYDLFEGAHGLMVYLLTMGSLSGQVYTAYIDSLRTNLETTNELIPISVARTRHSRNLSGINLGIPHGVAGCILMLCRLYQLWGDEGCRKLLGESLRYFIDKSRQNTGDEVRFTYSDHPDSEYPPLAWCYGDLPAGYTITKAGVILSESEWIDRGLDILDSTLDREDFVEKDLSLCHGAPCIAYLYRQAFLLSDRQSYQERCTYWTSVSMQVRDLLQDEGPRTKDDYQENASLIYGFPGIELAIQTMCDRIPADWDDWMLL